MKKISWLLILAFCFCASGCGSEYKKAKKEYEKKLEYLKECERKEDELSAEYDRILDKAEAEVWDYAFNDGPPANTDYYLNEADKIFEEKIKASEEVDKAEKEVDKALEKCRELIYE